MRLALLIWLALILFILRWFQIRKAKEKRLEHFDPNRWWHG